VAAGVVLVAIDLSVVAVIVTNVVVIY